MAKLKSGTRIYGTATIDTSVVVGSAVTANSSGVQVSGAVTATSFFGSGSNLTGLVPNTVTISNVSTPQFIGFSTTSSGVTTSILASSILTYIPSSNSLGIGTNNPTVALQLSPTASISNVGSGITLAGTVGSALTVAQFYYANNNASYLRIKATRTETGSSWTTASTKLLQVIDVTEQAYIEYNPNGALSGMAFGSGATEWARFLSDGNLGIGITNPGSKLAVIGDASISGLTTTNNLYVAGVGTFLSSGLKIRNPANTFGYTITGDAIAADRILNLPVITATDTVAVLGLTQTFSAAKTFSSSLTHSATTASFTASSYTTGTVTIGGASQTGAIVLGQSTASQLLGIATGTSSAGVGKTIDFGTGGGSGSFTQINIGPTAGVGTVTINSGTNLGIGTATTAGSGTVHLDVVRPGANIQVRNTSTTGQASVFASDADYFTSFKSVYISKLGTAVAGNIFSSIPNANLGILAFQNTTNALIYTNGGAPLIFGTTSTEAMRIDSSQRVGIGTNNPSHTLHVQGNARITGAFRDSTNQPGVAGQILQSTNSGTTWVTASSVPAGGRFDTSIDSAIYVQPTGTLDVVGVGTTTTQITTLPSGTNEYVIHSMHVTNVSNGDAEITAGFAINGRRVSTTGSLGNAGIATFTVSSVSGILVGMAVSGTSFQSSTYVTSVDGTAVSVSKPMTGSTSGTVVFTPVSKVASRLPVPVGSAVELLKQPMVLNALDSIVLQSTGAGTGIGSTSTAAISQTANSNILTVTAGAAITNFIASGMLIQGTSNNTGIQTNTFVGVGYIPGALSVPMTRPARSTLSSQILSFTEVALPQDGALQVAITYQSSLTDFSYQNGTGTVAALSPTVTSVSSGLSTIPVAYYSTGNIYQSVVQSIRVTNISDGTTYPGGDYPVSVGIGNSDTIFSWLAYNMVIPRNSSIELCEAPKRVGIGQSIFAFSNTPYAIEIQVTGKQKTT
jgi:hypothetical protein